MEIENVSVNDLKRKVVAEEFVLEVDLKKGRFEAPAELHQKIELPIDLSKINSEVEPENKIKFQDIRKLKELLRQEEAKLLLIKRIKASITLADPAAKPGKPVIVIANPTQTSQISTGIVNIGRPITIPNPKMERDSKESIRTNINPVKKEIPRPTSPSSGSNTEKIMSTSASFEKNRVKREHLKQQLNKTLNEITQTPPAPTPDVNFFPSATNNEFLVLLGLEMCVNRLKKEDQGEPDVKSHECAECQRDFSPSWKYDADGRLLCNRCINSIDIKKLTTTQKSKFSEFAQFWKEKEIELKEIETQLQKDEKELRQQRLDAEKERVRRDMEARKRADMARLKEKEANEKKFRNQWPQLNKQPAGLDKTTQELLKRYMDQQKNNKPVAGFGNGSSMSNLQKGNSSIHSSLMRQLQQLANAGGKTGNNSGINSANHLASLHTQMIKQEMIQKLRQQEQEDNARQRAMEQLKREQMQLQQQQMLRRIQEQQRQQQATQRTQQQTPNAALLQQLSAIQTLLAANSNGSGSQQQIQQLLQSNPALNAQLNPLLTALASHARNGNGSRSPSNDRQHYIDILSPPKAHSNKR